MPEIDAVLPDDIPVVDAVAQQRPTGDVLPEDDRDSGVPLETTASDWQEQRETVLIDPDLDALEQ